jgi:opacity protein-like surface antigen
MKALVLVLGLLLSVNSYADYFKGGLGYSLGGEVSLSGAGSGTDDLDSSFLFPIIAAYGFEVYDQFNAEVEVAFRNNDYDETDADASATTVALNAVGAVPVGGAKLTGGLGVLFGSFDPGIALLDAGTAFGIQIFGGVDFPIQDNITLGGEIRYLTTITDADFGNDVDGEYSNTALMFVAKFGL